MKFRKIEFTNHPILGNVAFDFTDKQGHTVDNIIIAGENGCGKSVLLNELFGYNPARQMDLKQGCIMSEIELNDNEMLELRRNDKLKSMASRNDLTNVFWICQDFSIKGKLEQIQISIVDFNKNNIPLGSYVFLSLSKFFYSIFSDVEINFTPKNLSSVTAKNIDSPINSAIKSTGDIATEITQLLIDIHNLDNEDLANWVKENPCSIPPDIVKEIRMKRFTSAFNKMFPKKRFKKIDNISGQKKILFEEQGRIMPIENLSSGEKQIVFRGGFLLKDKDSCLGVPVLVDEPEISLHPNWQLKIMSFLKSLFTNAEGIQTSQIITTTHSPFIIHGAREQNEKVIVMTKNENGGVSVMDNPTYYACTTQQIVEQAFNITYALPNDKITVFVEGETDEAYYNKALEVFNYGDCILNFQWIGRNTGKGKAENTGDTALNNAVNFYKANPSMISNKVVLLYDCDTHKPNEDNGSLYVRAMSQNNNNLIYRKGVENLLVIPANFNKDDFYTVKTKTDDYGAESTNRSLNKMKLCNFICEMQDAELQQVFANFKTEIENILNDKSIIKE